MFDIRWTGPPLADFILKLTQTDAPEAAYVATLRTSLAARKRVVAELDSYFTIRRRSWIARGIRFKMHGSKNGRLDAIYSQLGTVDDFMRDHDKETPPTLRKPGKSGHRAIPIGARPTPTYVTPPTTWPERMLRRKRGGTFKIRSGGREFVMERTGAGVSGVRVMWVLQPEGTVIQPRWPMTETVRQEVESGFMQRFTDELDKLATKRARQRRRT